MRKCVMLANFRSSKLSMEQLPHFWNSNKRNKMPFFFLYFCWYFPTCPSISVRFFSFKLFVNDGEKRNKQLNQKSKTMNGRMTSFCVLTAHHKHTIFLFKVTIYSRFNMSNFYLLFFICDFFLWIGSFISNFSKWKSHYFICLIHRN